MQVSLNLLNKFGISVKILGLPSILSLFCNNFKKFNNTGAQMLYSIYHMTLKLPLKIAFLAWKHQGLPSFTQRYNGCHYAMLLNLLTTSGLSILLHGVISLPDATSCDNTCIQVLHRVYKFLDQPCASRRIDARGWRASLSHYCSLTCIGFH